MKRETKNILVVVLFFAIIFAGRGISYYKKNQYKKAIQTLTSMQVENIAIFRVYPKVGRPVGEFVEFRDSIPIVDEFVKSLTDQRRADSSLIHDGVSSVEHCWFLEIATKSETLQINCYIPARREDIVVGEFLSFDDGRRNAPYDSFQSRNLYQWYQKYRHRWLTPEEPSAP
jgi:hypothetical protein